MFQIMFRSNLNNFYTLQVKKIFRNNSKMVLMSYTAGINSPKIHFLYICQNVPLLRMRKNPIAFKYVVFPRISVSESCFRLRTKPPKTFKRQ